MAIEVSGTEEFADWYGELSLSAQGRVAFVIELFLTQVIGERSKQMIVSRSQDRRVRWMGNNNPS